MSTASRRSRARRSRAVLWLLIASSVVTCSPKPTTLDRVRTIGVLKVATTNSPTTCYDGAAGATGYECDLLTGLARALRVRLELHFVTDGSAVLAEIAEGRADLGAAGLNVTPARSGVVRFTMPIQYVRQQLVYDVDRTRPADLASLDGKLAVPAGSPQAERLGQLAGRYPGLQWDEPGDESAEDLLSRVASDELDYTIANSDLIAIDQRYAPQLRVAFDLSDTQDIAWAMPLEPDDTLFEAVQGHLRGIGQTELDRMRDRYFGHVAEGDYQGVVRFAADVGKLLPRYRDDFEDAAERFGLDWRLLAAIGYQESHWDPDAVSHTGVRGIMMLTADTATRMEVANRENPAQSIRGGARYLQQMLKSLPASIEDPDRSWMALAAYNQGLGHVLDARILAEQNGNDPDRWVDVRDTLPLLTRERWFSQTRHGYSRGREAVNFVANVRSYYDLLSWMSGGQDIGTIPTAGGSGASGASGASGSGTELARSSDARLSGHSEGAPK